LGVPPLAVWGGVVRRTGPLGAPAPGGSRCAPRSPPSARGRASTSRGGAVATVPTPQTVPPTVTTKAHRGHPLRPYRNDKHPTPGQGSGVSGAWWGGVFRAGVGQLV
jgi:hypothetical protein